MKKIDINFYLPFTLTAVRAVIKKISPAAVFSNEKRLYHIDEMDRHLVSKKILSSIQLPK